jgi:hypothetical protein
MNKEFLRIVSASPKAKTASKSASPKVKTVSPKVKTVSKSAAKKVSKSTAKTASKSTAKTVSKSAAKTASPKVKTVSKSEHSGYTTSKSPSSHTRSQLYNPYQKKWIPVSTMEGMNLRKLIKYCEKCPKKGEFYDSDSKKCVSRDKVRDKDLETSNFCAVYKRETRNRTEQDIRIINNILESKVDFNGTPVAIKDIGNLDKKQIDQRIKQGDTSYAVLQIANVIGRIMKQNPRLGDKMRNRVLDNIKDADKGFAALFFTIFKKNIKGNIIDVFQYLSFGEITAILGAIFGAFWKAATYLLSKYPNMFNWGKKVATMTTEMLRDILPAGSTIELVAKDNKVRGLLYRDGIALDDGRTSQVPVKFLGLGQNVNRILGRQIEVKQEVVPDSGIFKGIPYYEVVSSGRTFHLFLSNRSQKEALKRIKNVLNGAIKGPTQVELLKQYNQRDKLRNEIIKLRTILNDERASRIKRDLIPKQILEIKGKISKIDAQYKLLLNIFDDGDITFMTQFTHTMKPLVRIHEDITPDNVNYYWYRLNLIDPEQSLIKIYTYINHYYQLSQGKKMKQPSILEGVEDKAIHQWVTNAIVMSDQLDRAIRIETLVVQPDTKNQSTLSTNTKNPYKSDGSHLKTLSQSNLRTEPNDKQIQGPGPQTQAAMAKNASKKPGDYEKLMDKLKFVSPVVEPSNPPIDLLSGSPQKMKLRDEINDIFGASDSSQKPPKLWITEM